jgi:cysteine synthase A
MTVEPENAKRPIDQFRGIKHLVGNTPLLAVHFLYKGKRRVIYAKAEHVNMTGSIKDRMAFHILQRAHAESSIQPNDTIVEATSGNTGIAFAALGRALGHPVIIYMPNWMSQERIQLIQSLGARTVLVTREEGGFLGSIRMAEDLTRTREHIFLPHQFSNQSNVDAHAETTGPEIWWQLQFQSLTPVAFVAGVGTGGTIMGVGRFLRKQSPSVRIHPLQPVESPTLTTGRKVGHHRIQGISDEFIPPILDFAKVDEIISVHDGDSILMAQKLAAQIGLAVGISSGANFIGALLAQEKLGSDAVVATVFPDDNKKYLTTDLLREEPAGKDYLSPDVTFLGYEALKRVCHTCCDLYDCTQRVTA